jgi:hypothetical protein
MNKSIILFVTFRIALFAVNTKTENSLEPFMCGEFTELYNKEIIFFISYNTDNLSPVLLSLSKTMLL